MSRWERIRAWELPTRAMRRRRTLSCLRCRARSLPAGVISRPKFPCLPGPERPSSPPLRHSRFKPTSGRPACGVGKVFGDMANDKKQDTVTAGWGGLGVTWIVGSEAELTVEETGSDPKHPPLLVLAGAPCVVMLRPPDDPAKWPACVRFLRQLRDGAEDLAAMLEDRAMTRLVRDDEAV